MLLQQRQVEQRSHIQGFVGVCHSRNVLDYISQEQVYLFQYSPGLNNIFSATNMDSVSAVTGVMSQGSARHGCLIVLRLQNVKGCEDRNAYRLGMPCG